MIKTEKSCYTTSVQTVGVVMCDKNVYKYEENISN